MFRAEMEDQDGVVRGIYTVADQEGNVETQAYISGGHQGGHRWAVYTELEDTLYVVNITTFVQIGRVRGPWDRSSTSPL